MGNIFSINIILVGQLLSMTSINIQEVANKLVLLVTVFAFNICTSNFFNENDL